MSLSLNVLDSFIAFTDRLSVIQSTEMWLKGLERCLNDKTVTLSRLSVNIHTFFGWLNEHHFVFLILDIYNMLFNFEALLSDIGLFRL